MAKAKRELPAASLYESDYYTWALQQAALLRERRLAELDLDNLAEEVEDLGRSLADQLESRYETLLTHLLKWEFQPGKRTRSWAVTIGRERIRIPKLLRKNPGLKSRQRELYADAYDQAREEASLETNLPLDRFPAENPYTLDQATDPEFWPGGRELPARDTARPKR